MSARSYLDLAVQRTVGIRASEKDAFATLGTKIETTQQQLYPAAVSPKDNPNASDWGEIEVEDRLSTRETPFAVQIPKPDQATRTGSPFSETRLEPNTIETKLGSSSLQTDKASVRQESDRPVAAAENEAPLQPRYSVTKPEDKAPTSIKPASFQPSSKSTTSAHDQPLVQKPKLQLHEPPEPSVKHEQLAVPLVPMREIDHKAISETSKPSRVSLENATIQKGAIGEGQQSYPDALQSRSDSAPSSVHTPIPDMGRPMGVELAKSRSRQASPDEAGGEVEIRTKAIKRQGEAKEVIRLVPQPQPTEPVYQQLSGHAQSRHERGSKPQPDKTPRLTIGRIEVYVTPPEAPPKAAKPKGPRPSLSRGPYSIIGLGQT